MAEEDEIVRSWPPLPALTSTYSNITASGSSKFHAGNVFNFYQSCSVQHDQNEATVHVQHANLKRKRPLADTEANPRTPEAQRTLDTVLKKLGKLALSIRHQKEGEGAEKIARRVAAVFDVLVAHRDREAWDKKTERQVGKLGNAIKWADLIDVNSVPHREAPMRGAEARTRRISVQLGGWNISLTTTTVGLKGQGDIHELDMLSSLRIEPGYGISGSPLAVFFSEQTKGHVRSTIPPKVLAYNKLSNSAEVFGVVLRDDIDDLRRLLDSGQASIRDCDEEGRSLLHYACDGCSFRCCSFLISLGADVDRFVLSFGARTPYMYYASPLHLLADALDYDHKTVSCLKALLRAGADPTLQESLRRNPAIGNFIISTSKRPAQCVHSILEESSAYMDFSYKDRFGRGYWLKLCSAFATSRRPEILYQCIRAGADVTEIDDEGLNCLFLFMADANRPHDATEIRYLLVLLTIFDNIYARDARGNDVFVYVNEVKRRPGYKNSGAYGSYKQDLWYCALARSGLDVRYGVQPCNRIARYTRQYTPRYYQALCYLEDWSEETDLEEELLRYPLTEKEEAIQLHFDGLSGWTDESDSSSDEGGGSDIASGQEDELM